MRKIKLSIVVLLFITVLCEGYGQDVYVVGSKMNAQGKMVATLWKNGVTQNLTDGTYNAEAYSIHILNDDIFIVGRDGKKGTLWKNGIAQSLTDGTNYAEARSICVTDSDVYIVGWESSENLVDIAMLWKNGIAHNLTDKNRRAETCFVYVLNGDVYVVGYQFGEKPIFESNDSHRPGKRPGNVVKLWKNGIEQKLSDETGNAYAKSAYIAGNDIYVVGYEWNTLNKCVAKLWKNGIVQNLDGLLQANSIHVLGSDVYVVGYDLKHSTYYATLWKNGMIYNFSDGTSDTYAHSVYVLGSDIYVVGYESKEKDKNFRSRRAVLWKNGVIQNLSNENVYSEAYYVFVK
jgi:uncharacterized membrane protein